MKSKTPRESLAITTKIVLPNDTNMLNNLFGGKLMAWMDETASISAHRHSNRVVVTASVSHVAFNRPIAEGEFVTIEAKVCRAFTSSMEVFIDVWVENPLKRTKEKANEAIFNFVAVDQGNQPIAVPQLVPETELEKKRFDAALRRRQLSLVLSGKMKAREATELKAIFED